jgi:hypothetical protein
MSIKFYVFFLLESLTLNISFAGPGFSDYIMAEGAIDRLSTHIHNATDQAVRVIGDGTEHVIRPRKHLFLNCCQYPDITIRSCFPFGINMDNKITQFNGIYTMRSDACGKSIQILAV